MFVNVAVLKETQPYERRVALVPSVTARLIKLGARLHMQSGAGDESKFADSSFTDVAFIDDRSKLVGDADVVLAAGPRQRLCQHRQHSVLCRQLQHGLWRCSGRTAENDRSSART